MAGLWLQALLPGRVDDNNPPETIASPHPADLKAARQTATPLRPDS